MNTRFGLIAAAVLTMTAVFGGTVRCANPTAIVSAASGYTAGNPATANPSGFFTVDKKTVATDQFQVVVDYGQLVNGAFVPWGQGPAAVTVGIVTQVNVQNYTWGPAGQVNLVNPPTDLQVRARVQFRIANNVAWSDIGTGYGPCP